MTGNLLRPSRFSAPLGNELDNHAEAAQTAAQQHSSGGAAKGGKTDWFDVPPRNDVSEKVRGDFAGAKAEQATQNQAGQRGDGDGDKGFLDGHGVKRIRNGIGLKWHFSMSDMERWCCGLLGLSTLVWRMA